MKKSKLIFLVLVVLGFSCSDELENYSQSSKLQITLGNVAEDVNGGRTKAIIVQPYSGTYYTGNTMAITWSFMTCLCDDWSASNIHIDLYKGGTYITRIASSVPFVDVNV